MYFHPLNFIRFLLALGVVLFHYGIHYAPFNSGWLHTLIINSSFRVSFFFFISGFVMTLVYGPQLAGLRASDFYRKRLTRIAPMYWLAFVITLALVVFVNNAGPKGLVIILHFLGLQSWYPGYVLDLNYPAWSISVELFFYALFPFLLKMMFQLSVRRLMALSLFLWMLQSLQHIVFVELVWNGSKATEEFISDFPLWHLVTFICGMTTSRLILANAVSPFITRRPLLWFVAAILVLIYVVFIPNPVLKYIHNGLLAPVFSLLVLALYFDRSLLHQVLSLKPLSRLGDLSYGLFIFQYPIWIISTALFAPFVQQNWFFWFYLVNLLLFAGFVNAYVERPLLKYLRREKRVSV